MTFIRSGKNKLGEFRQLPVLTLATVGADGELHAADVCFAADESLNLFFFSDPASQHAKDIIQNPRAAATIHPECLDWREIRGLQLRGRVSIVTDARLWEQAWKLYQQKFPFAAELAEVVAQNQLYIFEPEWVRLVDNRVSFGYKQEWQLRTEG